MRKVKGKITRPAMPVEHRIASLHYELNILEQVREYAQEAHQPTLMKIINEKALEHKYLMKGRAT